MPPAARPRRVAAPPPDGRLSSAWHDVLGPPRHRGSWAARAEPDRVPRQYCPHRRRGSRSLRPARPRRRHSVAAAAEPPIRLLWVPAIELACFAAMFMASAFLTWLSTSVATPTDRRLSMRIPYRNQHEASEPRLCDELCSACMSFTLDRLAHPCTTLLGAEPVPLARPVRNDASSVTARIQSALTHPQPQRPSSGLHR